MSRRSSPTLSWVTWYKPSQVRGVYAHGAIMPPAGSYTSLVHSLTMVPKGTDVFWKHELDHSPAMNIPLYPMPSSDPIPIPGEQVACLSLLTRVPPGTQSH